MEITPESLNENTNRDLKLTTFFEQIIDNFDEQLESDETFWSKFFSFDDKRQTKYYFIIFILLSKIEEVMKLSSF